MLELLAQTPSFIAWTRGSEEPNINNMRKYQASLLRVADFICVADLLWPEFVEMDDLLLRKTTSIDRLRRNIQDFKDKSWSGHDIEYAINHLHISDIFINDPDRDEIGDSVYLSIANMIAKVWNCAILSQFPKKKFEIGIRTEEDPEVFVMSCS